MKTTSQHLVLAAASVLMLAVLACNPPGTLTPTGDQTTTSQAAEVSRTPSLDVPTFTPATTNTPVPDIPGPGDCTLNAVYVADITVPDGSELLPGIKFVKTWRIRNTGTCTWEEGTQLVFISGDELEGSTAVDVPAVAPNAQTDISVDLKAPTEPGSYKSNWQLQAPDGTRFGNVIYIKFVIPAPATDTPTPTRTLIPTDTPTVGPAGTLSPPDLRISDLAFAPDILVKNVPIHVLATLHNDGSQNLSGVKVHVENHFSHPHASCTNMDMVDVLYETTVDLNAGQALEVDYTIEIDTAWEHLVCVKIDPEGTITETNEANNYQGQAILVGTLTTVPLDGSNSGSIRADGYTAGYPNPQPGDASDDQRVHGFLSWNLSTIPAGAHVIHAHVTWNTQCYHGDDIGSCSGDRDPFPDLGRLWVRAYYYEILDSGDFAAAGLNGGTMLTKYAAQPTGNLDVTDAVGDALSAEHPFQIYTLFEYDTNSDGFADGLRFEEGSGKNMLTVVHMP
jgi:hypothetical protein